MTLQTPAHRYFELYRIEQEYSIPYSLCCILEVVVPKLLPWLGFVCTQGFLQMVRLVFVQLSAVSGNMSCVAALRHFGITSRTDKDRILFFLQEELQEWLGIYWHWRDLALVIAAELLDVTWRVQGARAVTCPSVCEARLRFPSTCRSKLEVFLGG